MKYSTIWSSERQNNIHDAFLVRSTTPRFYAALLSLATRNNRLRLYMRDSSLSKCCKCHSNAYMMLMYLEVVGRLLRSSPNPVIHVNPIRKQSQPIKEHALSPIPRYAPRRAANQKSAKCIANPTAPTSLRLRQLPSATTVVANPKSSTVVMAQERSGIVVGLNKGHVR